MAHAPPPPRCPVVGLTFHLSAERITERAHGIVRDHTRAWDAVAALSEPDLTFANTFLAIARADTQAACASAECTLPALVRSGEEGKAARQAGTEAKRQLAAMWDAAYARADVFAKLRALAKEAEGKGVRLGQDSAWGDEGARLVDKTLAMFKASGLGANPDHAANTNALKQRVAALASQCEQAINEDNTQAEFTEAELKGVSRKFVASLPRKSRGNNEGKGEGGGDVVLVGCKAPQLVPVLQGAELESSRERMARVSGSRCEENRGRLEELLVARHELAQQLGFPSHAHRVLAGKMARTPAIANDFLDDVAARLKDSLQRDLDAMQAELGGDKDSRLSAFNASYCVQRIKAKLEIDEESLRPYFPLTHVIASTLGVYQEVLQVRFSEESSSAVLWDKDTQLFAVRDAATDELLGYFYLDLFSRDGKYSHQCVVPIRPAFERDDGSREVPVCAILGNMSRPMGDEPSLLRFAEVITFFHEFGHVMHAVLSHARCSLFSWAWPMVPWPGGVEQDFLETPSMMFQQWVYEKDVLTRLSCHVETSAPLPDAVIEKLVKARHVAEGYSWTKFIAMAKFDLIVHSGLPPYSYNHHTNLDLKGLWHALMDDLTHTNGLHDTFPPASWLHPVSGYDGGYYGYLWSEVYAHDLFSCFTSGCLDQAMGKRLRDCVLSQGAREDGMVMLRRFLGREPNNNAFVAQFQQ